MVYGRACAVAGNGPAQRPPRLRSNPSSSVAQVDGQSNFTYRVTFPDMPGVMEPLWPEQLAER